MKIKLRGYQYKFLEKDGSIGGGCMWISNEKLNFISTNTGNEYDLCNTEFKYEDLMLCSPFSINSIDIFEEDILRFKVSRTTGVVKQDIDLGWVIITKTGIKHKLNDSILDLELIGNSFEDKDIDYDFTIARKVSKANKINKQYLYLVEESKTDNSYGSGDYIVVAIKDEEKTTSLYIYPRLELEDIEINGNIVTIKKDSSDILVFGEKDEVLSEDYIK